MKVLHAVFHRRLVGPDLVLAGPVQRAPALVHALGDFVVLRGSFHIRGLFGLDELALEQCDVLGIVELDDIGRAVDGAREQRAYDQHVRVPLEHDVRIDCYPDRAMLRRLAAVILEHGLVPALVGPGARFRECVLDADGLHRVALGELPTQVIGGDELAQPRVERADMIILQIDLDEAFPVVLALVDLDPVEHVARKVEVLGDADTRELARDVAWPVEQQPVPVGKRRAVELDAGLLFEMRRAEQRAFEVVSPAVHRTHDVLGVAAALEHHRLAMAADIRQQLHAAGVANEHLCVIAPRQRIVIARIGYHQLVPDVAGTGMEQTPLLEFEQGGIAVPGNGQLRRGLSQPIRSGEIGHRPFPYVTNPTIRGENPRPSTALLSQPATGEPVKAASSNTSSL